MDSPIVARLFRQLFRHHPTCTLRQNTARLAAAIQTQHVRRQRQHQRQLPLQLSLPLPLQQRCHYSTRGRGGDSGLARRNESNWQQRTMLLPQDMSEE